MISAISILGWQNSYCASRVFRAVVEKGPWLAWSTAALPPQDRAWFATRFPGVMSGPVLAAPAFIAAIAARLQVDILGGEGQWGVVGNHFWLAAPDPFYAQGAVNVLAGYVMELAARRPFDPPPPPGRLETMETTWRRQALDQFVCAMSRGADRAGIPWFRVSGEGRFVQMGHCAKQTRFRGTLSQRDHALGDKISHDKFLTNQILAAIALPVGKFALAQSVEQAVRQAEAMGYPLVIKPVASLQGIGVTVNITDRKGVAEAATKVLQTVRQPALLQSLFPGDDHRLLVVSGRFLAAARRDPAAVTGDGVLSIAALVTALNADPRRRTGEDAPMVRVPIDADVIATLASQQMTPESIPAKGQRVLLRRTANISSGGTATDVTEIAHPDNVWLAERAAKAIGLRVAGIDFITPDISRSWREVGGGICEVNASVGLRPHWLGDPSRDVVTPILRTDFAEGDEGRIPTAMVTGSNGKTTTTRMIDHILRAAGHVVGCATSDGVTINGQDIMSGDLAGYPGAEAVLRDPTVTAAALETARGGILRFGLALDRCDAAALLNVTHEHVGYEGVASIEEMAALKQRVIDIARRAAVLNAEDALCLKIAAERPSERTVLFALDPAHPALAPHLARGGGVVTLLDLDGAQTIVLRTGVDTAAIIRTDDVPATMKGALRFNIANALAAVGLAHGMGLSHAAMREGLGTFTLGETHSSGRFSLVETFAVPVLLDYAHNPPALAAFIEGFARTPRPKGRRIVLATSPGNRLDERIAACAAAVAGHFDIYIAYEHRDWRRDRPKGQIATLMCDAWDAAGLDPGVIHQIPDQREAIETAVSLASPDDLIIILGATARDAIDDLKGAFTARS